MITPEYARTMARYNAELNRRVYGAALRLSDAQRRSDEGAFWKSIHGTLSHLYWADRIWLSRFGAAQAPDVPIARSATMIEDFNSLWAQRQDLDQVLICPGTAGQSDVTCQSRARCSSCRSSITRPTTAVRSTR